MIKAILENPRMSLRHQQHWVARFIAHNINPSETDNYLELISRCLEKMHSVMVG